MLQLSALQLAELLSGIARAQAAIIHGIESALPGTLDLCFVIAVRPEDAIAQLYACGVPVERGPVSRIGALGDISSVYCRDPDGNLIELASYMGD